MDAISYYSFASCGWNAIQAISLLIGPQAIITLLTREENLQAAATSTSAVGEASQYLARSLGLALLALGFVTVALSGSVPVGSALDNTAESPSPYAAPVVLLTTLYHGSTAFHSWARYAATGRNGYFLGFVGSAVLAAFGIWCLLFGGEKGRISRRTGADKRTSGFPFRNAEADRRKVR
ncbi:hypothetical protein F5B22DRAFT_265936 [Xylaria bambusicola]|uniref:uncharacterized protein n=1 Tax=Xylaria bambusicola TaxID=326684 RepID=UPI002007F046|nr:uncharacterized protein F5B22DRAFT_265936 [Xylaria bambusicola]KAI0526046.1 hypothetical protein F5B22DRAFT_265936 [Xylaria bambusicola]